MSSKASNFIISQINHLIGVLTVCTNFIRRIWNFDDENMSRYSYSDTMREGIEGQDNSCYLDSTLFSMFAKTKIFDPIFLGNTNGKVVDKDKTIVKIKGILREIVENNLRKGFCPSSKIQDLRTVLSQFNPRMIHCELDVDDLIATLFGRALTLEPFIQYGAGTSNFLHQLFLIPDSYYPHDTSIDVQTCLEKSMNSQCLTLASIPSPALFIKMPRSNGRLIGFDYIFPNLTLDIKSIMDKGCVLDDSIMREKCQLQLMAVICLSNHHYTTYVRQGHEISSPWVYFNSMPPSVTPVPGLGEELQQLTRNYYQGHFSFFDIDIGNWAMRLVSNIHVCIYEPVIATNSKGGEGGTMKRDRDEVTSLAEVDTKRSRRSKNKNYPHLTPTTDDEPMQMFKNYQDNALPTTTLVQEVGSNFVQPKQDENEQHKSKFSKLCEFFGSKASSSSKTRASASAAAETQTSGQLDPDLNTDEQKLEGEPKYLPEKDDWVNLMDCEILDTLSPVESEPIRTKVTMYELPTPTAIATVTVHSPFGRPQVRERSEVRIKSDGENRFEEQKNISEDRHSAVAISVVSWPPLPPPPPSSSASPSQAIIFNFPTDVENFTNKNLNTHLTLHDNLRRQGMKEENMEEILTLKEEEVEKGCPCGLESLSFTLFHTTVFDDRLFMKRRDDGVMEESVFDLLKSASREMRRGPPFAWEMSTKDIVREVWRYLKALDLKSIEDIDALIQVLFSKLKRLGSFILYTSGNFNFFHTINLDTDYDHHQSKKEENDFVNLQFLFKESMRHLQFQRTPTPALFIKIKHQQGYCGQNRKKIVPNLILDLTGQTKGPPVPCKRMNLYAIICLSETKHYTAFVKKAPFDWLFFDTRQKECVMPLDNLTNELRSLEKFACTDGMKNLTPRIHDMVSSTDFVIYLPQNDSDSESIMV